MELVHGSGAQRCDPGFLPWGRASSVTMLDMATVIILTWILRGPRATALAHSVCTEHRAQRKPGLRLLEIKHALPYSKFGPEAAKQSETENTLSGCREDLSWREIK